MKKQLLSLSRLTLLLAVAAVGFSSCGDDDDNKGGTPASNKTKTQLLTDNNWKISAMTYDSTGTSSDEDIWADEAACNKDDVFNMQAASATATNGTTIWTEGATKCDPSSPDTVSVTTWSFANTEQTKILAPDPFQGVPREWDIVELNASSLKLRWNISSTEQLNWHFTH